jgi:hypothetical protein
MSNAVVMRSTNGFTWATSSTAQSNTWTGIADNGTRLVAVSSGGTNRVQTSTDGITWVVGTASAASAWTSIVYCPANGNFPGTFFAADTGANVMWSTNGISWSSTVGGGGVAWPAGTRLALVRSGDMIRPAIVCSDRISIITYDNGANYYRHYYYVPEQMTGYLYTPGIFS